VSMPVSFIPFNVPLEYTIKNAKKSKCVITEFKASALWPFTSLSV
jgi:hypothetical protein